MKHSKISGMDMLIEALSSGCKPLSAWRIGTEHEKFPFYLPEYRPVPYGGSHGIGQLLEGMQSMLGWQPVMDEGNVIGLVEPTGMGAISLEPGGQFELSGAPLETIHQTYSEVNAHLSQLYEIAKPLSIGFLGIGASPSWSLKEIPSMPKSRYHIMKDYMPKVGSNGLDMMYRTATIQVNLDFSSERDMRRKMQVAMKLQPIATALFAASPFTDKKPNGFLSWRSEIWRHTDSQRSGILPFVFGSDFGFADYVEWALDIPMYFVVRNHRYYDATFVTFRQFMQGALRDKIPDGDPVMKDWVNHLSTVFPEVRLKQFLEMRGGDGGPLNHICALPAYWTGLLYDTEALAAAETLVQDWTIAELQELRDMVPKMALETPFRKNKVLDIAKESLTIAHQGLKNRQKLNDQGEDESYFLEPLVEIVNKGKTIADTMLDSYYGKWNSSVEPVFCEYSYYKTK